MKGTVGSVRWLLLHELRLAWFNMGASSGKANRRRPGTKRIVLLAAGWVALHVVAWFVLRRLGGVDRTAQPLLASVTAGSWLAIWLSAAFQLMVISFVDQLSMWST